MSYWLCNRFCGLDNDVVVLRKMDVNENVMLYRFAPIFNQFCHDVGRNNQWLRCDDCVLNEFNDFEVSLNHGSSLIRT